MSNEDPAVFQSVSFLQRCPALRDHLMQFRGFPRYFSLANPDQGQSIDPILQLWDLFSLGIPLCYIFDLLSEEDDFSKINYSEFNQDINPDHAKTRAIAHFAMQLCTDYFKQKFPDSEPLTVTDLWDCNSTGDFLKVVDAVTAIINYLPLDAFERSVLPLPMSRLLAVCDNHLNPTNNPKPATHSTKTQENIISELVETERKYGKDIELIHLFNFQRKFLIHIDGTAELAWQDQNWGQHFLEAEKEFSEVYAPYCAKYVNSSEFVVTDEVDQKLAPLNHLLNIKLELPAFIKKPVGRVCKYPLFLDSLLKASWAADYQHYDTLKKGSEASKCVTDTINAAQRRADIEQTVKSLQTQTTRVADWKGHNIDDFGELLLYDHFVVKKSAVDRDYVVFLFEKMLLLFKEVSKDPPDHRSLFSVARNTPLVLRGRILVSNVTQEVPGLEKDSDASTPYERQYLLTEYRLKVWESKIKGLIGPSGQCSQMNNVSGGFDVNEQPQTLVATLSRGSGPPSEIRDLNMGSPTPAGNTLPSNFQPRIRTEPNDASPTLTVVKVKVHINEAMFVLQVPQTIDYEGLVEKIMCKLRLLGRIAFHPIMSFGEHLYIYMTWDWASSRRAPDL
ncbi:hypothetical protein DFH08DRAFT_892181, partial [Mycena albidolilacea]